MSYVYILKSGKNGSYYIGSTDNLERRLFEHNSGKTKSLRFLRPVSLVFKKEFENTSLARVMERRLKKMKSRIIIERIIKDQDIKMGL